jgi:hypothetical protein
MTFYVGRETIELRLYIYSMGEKAQKIKCRCRGMWVECVAFWCQDEENASSRGDENPLSFLHMREVEKARDVDFTHDIMNINQRLESFLNLPNHTYFQKV